MIKFKQKGDFRKTEKYFKKLGQKRYLAKIAEYGEMGVKALASATPVDTGLTAASWYYEIEVGDDYVVLSFNNSNVQNGWANIAILLQYGHGTRNGGWVEGRDYINPAIQPLFDRLAEEAWEEVARV